MVSRVDTLTYKYKQKGGGAELMKEYIWVGIWISLNIFSIISRRYTVKKVSEFPVPSRDVTNQTLSRR